jgi:cell division transport system permease protein
MLIRFFEKALQDLGANRFLNTVTVITIALSILIVSAFALFFINADDALNAHKKGLRLMVYLKANSNEAGQLDLKTKIMTIDGVLQATFISRGEGLALLKQQMKRHAALLEDLKTNPLPDAFNVRLKARVGTDDLVEQVARQIEALPQVSDVEYGQQWIARFTHLVNLFRLAGYGLGSLFLMAAVFIVSNTIRLILYTRREEIEIMRLVGASDSFIKVPFYIEGLLQGLCGGLLGTAALFFVYLAIAAKMEQGLAFGLMNIRFFPVQILFSIVLGSVFIGWFGCLISLRQFFKNA